MKHFLIAILCIFLTLLAGCHTIIIKNGNSRSGDLDEVTSTTTFHGMKQSQYLNNPCENGWNKIKIEQSSDDVLATLTSNIGIGYYIVMVGLIFLISPPFAGQMAFKGIGWGITAVGGSEILFAPINHTSLTSNNVNVEWYCAKIKGK